jgi:hypothetical protein
MQVTITNESGHLMIQPKGQGKLEAMPTSETEFHIYPVDATFTFVPGPDGRSTELKMTQGGRTQSGKRVN